MSSDHDDGFIFAAGDLWHLEDDLDETGEGGEAGIGGADGGSLTVEGEADFGVIGERVTAGTGRRNLPGGYGRIGGAEAGGVENDEFAGAGWADCEAVEGAVGAEEVGRRNVGTAIIGCGGEEAIVLGVEAEDGWAYDARGTLNHGAAEIAILDDDGHRAIGEIVGSEGVDLGEAGEDDERFLVIDEDADVVEAAGGAVVYKGLAPIAGGVGKVIAEDGEKASGRNGVGG